VVGNHANQRMWIESEFPKGEVSVIVSRGISNIVFDGNINVTVFSYSYSYEPTYYEAKPRVLGLLNFPYDEHRLVLFIASSFNLTIDEHEWTLDFPSPNYEGRYQVRKAATRDEPYKHRLTLEIKHPSGFFNHVFLSIGVIMCLRRKKMVHPLRVLLPSSWAIIVFVPVFEISLQNLKHPLPFVLSDLLIVGVIPWNVAIIALAMLP